MQFFSLSLARYIWDCSSISSSEHTRRFLSETSAYYLLDSQEKTPQIQSQAQFNFNFEVSCRKSSKLLLNKNHSKDFSNLTTPTSLTFPSLSQIHKKHSSTLCTQLKTHTITFFSISILDFHPIREIFFKSRFRSWGKLSWSGILPFRNSEESVEWRRRNQKLLSQMMTK